MQKQKIPEFGTIERLNFDMGQIVAFIIGNDRPFKYIVPKEFVKVVIPFLPYEFEGPHYYRETVVFLAYWKLKDFARMEQFIAELMEEMDETFGNNIEEPLGKNLLERK